MSKVAVIMYHYVRNLRESRYPDIKGLDLQMFKDQIEYLGARGSFVSASDVVDAVKNGKRLPDNSVLLTFDDGYIDHYTNVFPYLYRKGIPAFFSMPGKILAERKVLDVNKIHFILAMSDIWELVSRVKVKLEEHRNDGYNYPSYEELYAKLAVANRFDSADTIFVKRLLQVELPEKLRAAITDELFAEIIGMDESAFVSELYLSYDQVSLMKQMGMEWGVHGYDHYWMNRLTPDELENDVNKALSVFEGIIPSKNWICCYPYGSISDEVVDIVSRMGAYAGFTTVVNAVDLGVEGGLDPFRIPRFDTNDFPPKSDNYRNFMSWA